MSDNRKIENQDLHSSNMNNDNSTKELSLQDLEAVSGGAAEEETLDLDIGAPAASPAGAVLGAVTTAGQIIDETVANPAPALENIDDPLVGGLVDGLSAADNVVDNIGNLF